MLFSGLACSDDDTVKDNLCALLTRQAVAASASEAFAWTFGRSQGPSIFFLSSSRPLAAAAQTAGSNYLSP
jgi:hypothetical protein